MAQQRTYSEKVAAEIDEEIKAIIDGAAARCAGILEEHQEQLHTVAAYLLEHETMDAGAFEQVWSAPAAQPVSDGEGDA